jgi:hypothetical protein
VYNESKCVGSAQHAAELHLILSRGRVSQEVLSFL